MVQKIIKKGGLTGCPQSKKTFERILDLMKTLKITLIAAIATTLLILVTIHALNLEEKKLKYQYEKLQQQQMEFNQ